MDLYNVLGVNKQSSKEDIKKAYRKLAMKFHPDRNSGDKDAEAKFKEVNEAYSVLGDDNKRQQYDTYGSVGGAGSPFGQGANGFNVDVDLGDIFESFFGGGNSGGKTRSTEKRGEDLEQYMNIDLKTSIYGAKESITFDKYISCTGCKGEGGSNKKACHKCNGTGRITYTKQSIFGVIKQTGICDECSGSGESFEKVCDICNGSKRESSKKTIEIDIPAGIDNGMVIKLTGEGNDGIGTKASGDLYVKFRVNLEEKGLRRDGVDLYFDLEIDVIEAILGTTKEVSIPVIGKRKIEIKSGIQAGTVIKFKNDGVKDIGSEDKGDLFIKLDIKIPKKLSKDERGLYEQIAKIKKISVNNKKGVFGGIFS